MKKLIAIILSLLSLFSLSIPACAATTVSLSWCNAIADNEAGVVYIRSSMSDSSSMLATLTFGTELQVKADTGSMQWFRAKYNGITGYCRTTFVSPSNEKTTWFSSSTLRRGFIGEPVANLQRALNNYRSYNLDTDGIFGSATEEAVIDFQVRKHLDDDGLVGSKTKDALLDYVR